MPTVKDFGAFKIVIYYGDHNPPHVHVLTPEQEGAKVAVRDGRVIAGDLPPAIRRKATAWIAAHRAALLKKWDAMN